MGKRSPSPPAPPDPVATARAQSAANVATAEAQARLNRINEITPFGTVRYERSPAAGGAGAVDPAAMAAYREALAKWNAAGEQRQGPIVNYRYEDGPGVVQAIPVYGPLPADTRGPMPAMPTAAAGGADEPSTYTRRIELPPAQQRTSDVQNELDEALSRLGLENVGRVRDAQGQPFTLSGLPEILSGEALNAERGRVEGDLFGRLEPMLERDRAALEQRLASQGIAPGSQAWRAAMDDIARARNDARMAVTGRGLSELQGLFGLGLSRRQQGITERAYERAYPINEIATLLGTAGPVQGPNFGAVPLVGVAPTDVTGPIYANYQGQLSNYNQQQQARNAALGGLFGLAGSIGGGLASGYGASLGAHSLASAAPFMFSDRRLKRDIRRIGNLIGLPLYTFRYLWSQTQTIGFMADDVARVAPHAVLTIGGYKAVNYRALGL